MSVPDTAHRTEHVKFALFQCTLNSRVVEASIKLLEN